ncbi:MAG: hypothetical protein ACYC2E_04470 [Sulfuricella sp.]
MFTPSRSFLTELFAASDPGGRGITLRFVLKNAPAFAADLLDHASRLFPMAVNPYEYWLCSQCSFNFTVNFTVKKRALLLAREMDPI